MVVVVVVVVVEPLESVSLELLLPAAPAPGALVEAVGSTPAGTSLHGLHMPVAGSQQFSFSGKQRHSPVAG